LPAFRWALIGCALFSVAGSLIAALTVHDQDAVPSRGLHRPSARRHGRHRRPLPHLLRTSGRPRPTIKTPPANNPPRAGGEGATAGARNGREPGVSTSRSSGL